MKLCMTTRVGYLQSYHFDKNYYIYYYFNYLKSEQSPNPSFFGIP